VVPASQWHPHHCCTVASPAAGQLACTAASATIRCAPSAGDRGVHVRESIRLQIPVGDVYRFWRRLDNLPQFVAHLERVTEGADGMSHWVASGPAGLAVEWDAEIINEVENKIGAVMRAVCWEGKQTIRVENVPDPIILNPRDAIIKVTTTAICGSDLHIYDGYIPTMHHAQTVAALKRRSTYSVLPSFLRCGYGNESVSRVRPRVPRHCRFDLD
jgi:hypothetical protein